ncbi:MAG: ImmA/IrrE family metallo-endopeptidase [Bacillus sp. (in: Bacteria)]|nr:ImmA/IrrE family metallo-endopeptidase [Bacillus sp. (in: firmicutes)]
MQSTTDYLAFAEAHGHKVYDMVLKENQSFCVEEDGECFIAMNKNQSDLSYKEHLLHELGHCEYGGFYNYHSPYDVRSRAENKANRWAYIHALPIDKVQEAIKSGCEEVWQIAEYFDLPPEFVAEGLKFYVEQLGLRI